MALPAHWVDALFQKFETFYGSQFAQKWAGCNIAAVKTEWAEKLGRFDGETLKAAVDYCGDNNQYPPTLPEFVTICKAVRVPPSQQLYLSHKFEANDIGRENLKKMKELLAGSRFGGNITCA